MSLHVKREADGTTLADELSRPARASQQLFAIGPGTQAIDARDPARGGAGGPDGSRRVDLQVGKGRES